MSIMDALLIFDEKRPITSVGQAVSTNVIDLGAGGVMSWIGLDSETPR